MGPHLYLIAVLLVAACGGQYINSTHLLGVPWGYRSHWAHPWRSFLNTRDATSFLAGIGANSGALSAQSVPLVFEMAGRHGIRTLRLDCEWGYFDYFNETLSPAAAAIALLPAKQWGIRPLLALNMNGGNPCPYLTWTIQLASTVGLIPGYSGLSYITQYQAAEAIFTSVNHNTNVVALSKPFPSLLGLAAGASVTITTFKYRPFTPPCDPDFNNTIAGWKKFVLGMAQVAVQVLGTAGQSDVGFDMEIYNELTFGSQYLDINNYYWINPYNWTACNGDAPDYVQYAIVQATAEVVVANPALFAGVRIGDGFPNTEPWTASSIEPSRITRIDKHPYKGRDWFNYNGQDTSENTTPLNALGQVDSWSPSYTAVFPEFYMEVLKTETILRDGAPFNTSWPSPINGRTAAPMHGPMTVRYDSGQVVPCPLWVTEVNIFPGDDNASLSDQACLYVGAKNHLRYYLFYLNKGVDIVWIFSLNFGNKNSAIFSDAWLNYTNQPNATYPADDTPWLTPSTIAISNMVNKFKQNMFGSGFALRQITVGSITDTHNHYQFVGDGTSAHPTLYDRDVFAVLPYQSSPTRFIIGYYVVTRDVLHAYAPQYSDGRQFDMPPADFTVHLIGINGANVVATNSISVYDPRTNSSIGLTVVNATLNDITLLLTATDSPYLLIMDDAAPPPIVTVVTTGVAATTSTTTSTTTTTGTTGASTTRTATSGGPASATTSSSHHNGGLSAGAIAGIVVGVVVLLALIAAVIVFVVRRVGRKNLFSPSKWEPLI